MDLTKDPSGQVDFVIGSIRRFDYLTVAGVTQRVMYQLPEVMDCLKCRSPRLPESTASQGDLLNSADSVVRKPEHRMSIAYRQG